jgi:fucose 4-O-acetylase-like acetyltransferase
MFHMPLFMAVSGYLFGSRPLPGLPLLLTRRLQQLITPVFVWSTFYSVVFLLICLLWLPESRPAALLHSFPRSWVFNVTYIFWYPWALFLAVVIVGLLSAIKQDSSPALVAAIILCLFLPSHFDLFKYTFPYFCLAYAAARNRWTIGKPILGLVLSLSVYLCCYFYWSKPTYIYTSGILINRGYLPIVGLRYLAGLAGSVAFVIFTKRIFSIWKPEFIIALGRKSYDIYLVHIFIIPALAELNWPLRNISVYSAILSAGLAVPVIAATYYISNFLNRSGFVARTFFGRTATA